jgi:hypothetical protein
MPQLRTLANGLVKDYDAMRVAHPVRQRETVSALQRQVHERTDIYLRRRVLLGTRGSRNPCQSRTSAAAGTSDLGILFNDTSTEEAGLPMSAVGHYAKGLLATVHRLLAVLDPHDHED